MDVFEAIKNRRSVRAYQDRPIPEHITHTLLSAIRYAPSGCNLQPWHFVLVKDTQLRQKLAEACAKQMWIAQAPLIIAACGFPKRAYQKIGGSRNCAEIDVTIALDHLSLAAVEQGLGSCWIGAFDEQQVKSLLAVPDDAQVVALMTIGYPASTDLNHPVSEANRKSPAKVFSTDRYDGN